VFVAKVIRSKLRGQAVSYAFSYRHIGSLAAIGRKAAVVDFGFIRLRGAFAWWLWGIAYVLFLLGSRNRVAVVLNWIWSYVTYRASTRLMTGSSPANPLQRSDDVALGTLVTWLWLMCRIQDHHEDQTPDRQFAVGVAV
jgi:hypothetical protein